MATFSKRARYAVLLMPYLFAITIVQADESPLDENFQLPVLMVTGEKIERTLQDTASAVGVVSTQQLEGLPESRGVSDVIKDFPNVFYTDTSGAPIIRGQDTQGPNFGSLAFFGGTVPRAAINQDGHYLSFYEFVYSSTSVWDLDTIEVFRGPQTSSQGANSIAGAIIVNTKDPSFTNEGAAQLEIGTDRRRRASLMFSGPLSDDLAARFTLDYNNRDTFIDYTRSDFATGDTDQDFENKNARVKLLWLPTSIPEFEGKLTYNHISNQAPTWESASSPYKRLENETGSMPNWVLDADTWVVDASYLMNEQAKVSNQLQYADLHVDRVSEPFDSGQALIEQENISNETRINFGTGDGLLKGVVGLYLAKTTSDDTLYIRGISQFDDKKSQMGLFTELNYRLSDRWLLTGGLRYQRDRIQRNGTSSYASGALQFDETFTAWLPRVSIAYDVSEHTTIGGLVSTGYNPGGVNLSFVSRDFIAFDDERVTNYELFARTRLLEERLGLSANLFYSSYSDSQRLLPNYLNGVQYGSVVVNAEEATSYGLELTSDFQATRRLLLQGSLGLLHSNIGSFTSEGGDAYEGNEFGKAPGIMVSVGALWSITPEWRWSGNIRYVDGYYSTDKNEAAYEVDDYSIVNTRIAYQPVNNMELYLYINNVFDKRAETYLYDDRSVGGIVANMLEPRQTGLGIKYNF
ncbi:TonB-dependent receptor [Neptunomonas phycophila]|uniref:TonB-dependent receptor n=1 Tax=Neptunomonas phycophila TaxID=1572645 RepID=UPI0015BA39D6|nr:TonB-dependent receptor [Neptunomonas phycophila]QLE96137.1 TonB-dependent receptor [Neptunomonas phycophila]